jgi:hypothetical protein
MQENVTVLGDAISRWDHRPTVQQRTGMRHALSRLLDDLAPETTPKRGAPPPATAIQRFRSPHGCILQGSASAVSVSWFPAAEQALDHGELVVIAWKGIVSHPGSARRARDGAVMLEELSLRPVEIAPTVWAWMGADDVVYDGAELAARCRGLLDR